MLAEDGHGIDARSRLVVTGAAEDVVGILPEHIAGKASAISCVVEFLESAPGGKEVSIHELRNLDALSRG